MFESSSNANSDLPMHQTSPNQFSINITDHHYPIQNPSYADLNFPSPLLGDDELPFPLPFLGTVLPYPCPPPPPPPPLPPSSPPGEEEAKEKGKRKRAVAGATKAAATSSSGGYKQKRRRGKTDRHSKINTAKGPRDRRMRLSLQIARKFFDLQDLLGFDKASKTIEWLFNKSKAAIKDLAESSSCTGMALPPSSPSDQDINVNNNNSNDKRNKKGVLLFQEMRENREKARARARERTKEKLLMMQKPNCNSNQIIEQSHCDTQLLPLEDQMASVGIIDNYLSSSSSANLFDYHNHNDHHHHHHHLSRVSSDTMMGSNEINFATFPPSWVSQNTQIQNPNTEFMGSPYNQGS